MTDTNTFVKIKGVDLIQQGKTTQFRIPKGRAYKDYQPVLTIINVEPTISEVATILTVRNEETGDIVPLAVRHTYDFEIKVSDDE
jgi:hypothetical protein